MSKHTVREWLTPAPFGIGPQQSLAAAHTLMRAQGIRHLPVLAGGKLLGLVSQRDLHLLETLADVDPESVPVEEAMSGDTYAVAGTAPLGEVASAMAEHKYGSAVVVEDGQVVGIFTTIDALRALAALAALEGPASPSPT